MPSPFLYFPDERLSPAELSAACLDGHLVGLGDAYIPADAVETAALRAGSLGSTLGDTLAATHLSAAWIHGALHEPPARHTVQRAVARRLHPILGRHLVYRDLSVDPADLVRIGGCLVTTPARTLADLVRIGDLLHDRAAHSVSRLQPHLADEALAWYLEHPRMPGKRRAIALLEQLCQGQDEVTR
ncbi:type IV toxin-antitoxin system AbiEi family antitoxin [Microbacterium sp. BWT-B31]|uniref:type IV toxin-antitoxin system AbiEi family antitoxin n=1 Tax=Microbacterium sp. BWT-B31 TaxID=3232072 RepID=UPI003528E372